MKLSCPRATAPFFPLTRAISGPEFFFNLVAILIFLLIGVPALLWLRPGFMEEGSMTHSLLFCAILIAYIIGHELTHGLAYRLMTRHRITFGISAASATCGVPDIFVYRKAALIALLSPFLLFTAIFLIPCFLCTGVLDRFYAFLLLALHLGGCAGDLYNVFLYLVWFRSPDTLMLDTGPRQTFYVRPGAEKKEQRMVL